MSEKALVVHDDGAVFAKMDSMDDELIKAELENRIVNTWVYSFPGSDGKDQTGLSKIGVDACCTEMAKRGNIIREGEIKFTLDPIDREYILFQGPASRIFIDQNGVEHLMEVVNGAKRQWIKQRLKSGTIIDDPFWFEKGAMKALRNARSRLIPEDVRTKIVTFAKEHGLTEKVKTTPRTSEPATGSQGSREPVTASCPNCGSGKNVMSSKYEDKNSGLPAGHWYCNPKKGGCGKHWAREAVSTPPNTPVQGGIVDPGASSNAEATKSSPEPVDEGWKDVIEGLARTRPDLFDAALKELEILSVGNAEQAKKVMDYMDRIPF